MTNGRRLTAFAKPFFLWMTGTRWFPKIAPKIIPRLDRALHRVSGGRLLMSDGMLPTLLLTTIGSKSGQERWAPLACLPEPVGSFLVVGSNFGRAHHPAWTTNLLKTPVATVSFRGRSFAVTGQLLEGEERAQAWPLLVELWPMYDGYTERSGRDLRVFRLEPTQPLS